MKKLTDQELDSVFKNAAEGYEPAFDPAAWDAMNAKLDQPRPALWKRWIPYALLGLVIFSTGVWVGIYMNEKPTLNQVPAEPQKEKIIEQKNINAQENQNQTPEVTNQIVGQKEGEIAKSSDVNHGNNLKRSITSEKKEIENSKPVIVADHSNLVDETKFILQGAKTSNEFEEIIAANPTDSVAQEVVEVKADTTQSDTEPKKKKQSASSHPIFLRALVSPDFSSISYSSATSTGSNYALLVEYQLTDRWSVATGGIWSMKKYATDEEFTYGKYTADRMTGECRILDIPLNIYYQIRPQEKFSFSAGLGLSSYIMQEEEYTYTFDLPSGSRDFSDYIEGENNEWFKVLNLSLGMQYQIAPRIQLQVEPFLKAPLSGVGEWDVLLSSMGIFMGLKYKIN